MVLLEGTQLVMCDFSDDDRLYTLVEYQQQQQQNCQKLTAEQPQPGQAVRSAREGGKDSLSQYKSLSCLVILLYSWA
jgi:hypothetical protein